MDIFFCQTFPKVYHVAHVCHWNHSLLFDSLADCRNQLIKIFVQFVYPTLLMTLASSQRIDFCRYADNTCYVTSLRLCTWHATKTSCNKQLHIVATHLACSVQHGDGCSVNDTLRADIHIRTRCHLTVLAYAECVVAFPIVWFRVIRNNHSVGNNYTWSILVWWEKTERMPRIHNKCLLVGHLTQVFHNQTVLCPVLENSTIATVCNQFVRVLSHSLVKVVLDHHHDSSSLMRLVWVFVNRTSVHFVCRAEAIHIYASVCF